MADFWKIKILSKVKKFNLDDETLLMGLTVVVGAVSGGVAVLLTNSVHWINHHLHTLETPTLSSLIYSLIFILIAGYLSTRIDPNISGSGIPRTKISYTVNHGIITVKEWSLKLIATILSLGSGFSLGREGPTVAIASGIGSTFGQFFNLSKNHIKTLLAVGSSSGIAAAFNTPIAAVTFTMEEIVGNMGSKSLGPIIVGSVVGTFIAQALTGGAPTFHIAKYSFKDPADLIVYLVIGVCAAFIGSLWVKTILSFRQTRISIFKGHRLTYLMTVSTLLFIVAFFYKDILGSGHELINELLLQESFKISELSILFGLKFIFIALCFSTGLSGGIFMPTLLLGSLLGAVIGLGAQNYFGFSTEIGAYTLIGMGAFFAAVIRAPITSILMIFEMTRDYRVMLPLMLANITAYIISRKLVDGSIYEKLSEQDGIHLPTKEDSEILEQLTVEEAMIRNPYTLNWETTIRESMMEINKTKFSGFPILKSGKLVGIVSKNQIAKEIVEHHEDVTVGSICTRQLITIYPDQSLLMALHYLERFKVSRLVVVSRLNPQFLRGIITAHDIVERFGLHIEVDNEQDNHLASIINDLNPTPDKENQE